MKTTTKMLLTALTLWAGTGSSHAQDGAFTYQGRLTDAGSPANGQYELRFLLWDADTLGRPVSPLVTNSPVTVSDGLFTTTIAMGSTHFDGRPSWLEISVRTNGGMADFVTLSPRQAMTPTPYALHAYRAALLTGPLHDAQIPASVARVDGTQTFTGVTTLNNPANSFTGNGAGLTGLNAGNVSSGTLADGRLSANVALRNAAQTFTGTNIFNHASNRFTGTFTGNGGGLTNLNAGSLTGAVPAASLTSIPAGLLTGTIADVRLSANVSRLDGTQTFSGPNSFSSDLGLNNKDILLRGLSDGNHGLGWHGDGKPFAGMTPDGPVLYGWAGGLLGTVEGGQRVALAWDASGNVGIGTAAPSAMLDVLGTVKAAAFVGDGATLSGLDRTSWSLSGNANIAPRQQFLGTRDNQPLDFRVNLQRALRLEPTAHAGAVNVIGGLEHNFAAPGTYGATVGGGGSGDTTFGLVYVNSIAGNFGTIGGGIGNEIQTDAHESTVAGGGGNTIQTGAYDATISGGNANSIKGHAPFATIGGGGANTIEGDARSATISGGTFNTILEDGAWATIPGGSGNSATTFAFAAGRRAKANHTGSFVWADSTDADFASTAANQFRVRATGGMEVVGGIRAGVGGTLQSRVQFGTTAVGAGIAGVNAFTIAFPAAFTTAPKVFVVARGNDNPDTFAVSTRAVTTSGFKVNILRLDIASGWGQNLLIDWYAVE